MNTLLKSDKDCLQELLYISSLVDPRSPDLGLFNFCFLGTGYSFPLNSKLNFQGCGTFPLALLVSFSISEELNQREDFLVLVLDSLYSLLKSKFWENHLDFFSFLHRVLYRYLQVSAWFSAYCQNVSNPFLYSGCLSFLLGPQSSWKTGLLSLSLLLLGWFTLAIPNGCTSPWVKLGLLLGWPSLFLPLGPFTYLSGRVGQSWLMAHPGPGSSWGSGV